MRLIWQMSDTARRLNLDNRLWDLDEKYVTPPGRVFIRNAERLYGLWFTTTNAARSGAELEESYRKAFNDPNATHPRTFQGKAYADSLETGSEAILVMLVASLEAYLRDLLTFAAQQDSSLLTKHPVEIAYESKEVAGWTSIDTVRAALPELWAKEWLRRRPSPGAMVSGLRKLGVEAINDDVVAAFDIVLGIRHLIVHTAGTVDDAFLSKHPGTPQKKGEKIIVGEPGIWSAATAVFDLFAPTEDSFARRFVRSA